MTDNSNCFRRLKLQKTIHNKVLVTQTLVFPKKKNKELKFKHYDNKLDCSISRARSSIFNIVYFNKFSYFFTQTISSKFNRSDLKLLINKFSDVTRNLRKIYPKNNFYYLVIPEYHLDGKSWHLHGFISEDYKLDSYINDNGFLSLHHFDKIGFNSISKIRNYDACLKYCSCYITKDLAKDRAVGERLFYCSQGLIRENTINEFFLQQIAPIHFDYKNEYVFKTTISLQEYYNMITKLDNITYY